MTDTIDWYQLIDTTYENNIKTIKTIKNISHQKIYVKILLSMLKYTVNLFSKNCPANWNYLRSRLTRGIYAELMNVLKTRRLNKIFSKKHSRKK